MFAKKTLWWPACSQRDEPVRAFAACLRGQAGVCNYKKNWTYSLVVDFSDIMFRDTLTRGLEDEEIRMDVLGQSRQDMILDEVLQYVVAKESSKRSASRLLEGGSTMTASAASSYKRRNGGRSPTSILTSHASSVNKRQATRNPSIEMFNESLASNSELTETESETQPSRTSESF